MYIIPELRENVHEEFVDGLNFVAMGSLPTIQYAIMYLVNRHIELNDNATSMIGALKVIEAEVYRQHILPVLSQGKYDNGEI